jgi:hypothetical protein
MLLMMGFCVLFMQKDQTEREITVVCGDVFDRRSTLSQLN